MPLYGLAVCPPPTVPKIIPKVLVLNARSLAKPDALPALYAELTSKNIDICVVSETWLNNNIQTQLITPQGYIVHRKDQSDGRIGGGVAIICRNDWSAEMHSINEIFECLWCKM